MKIIPTYYKNGKLKPRGPRNKPQQRQTEHTTTQPLSRLSKMATDLESTSEHLSIFGKSGHYYQDLLRATWESDTTKPWGRPYSKTERFTYLWDSSGQVERRDRRK